MLRSQGSSDESCPRLLPQTAPALGAYGQADDPFPFLDPVLRATLPERTGFPGSPAAAQAC